jgi:hypothetical protein
MGFFRFLLVAIFVTIAVYTAIVISSHGWNLLPIFLSEIGAMSWSGQFNLDFLSFLLLAGLWLAWRHDFSPAGLVLGLFGIFGGMMFMSAYLLIASITAGGDMKTLLLGSRRASC